MERTFEEGPDSTSDQAINHGKNYIKYSTETCLHPPDLFDRLIPLQNYFQAAGLILYVVHSKQNKIIYRQTNIYDKKMVDIKIEPGNTLAAAVAYEKHAYLIENPIRFAKQHLIKLDMDVLKNCIYCFPVLNFENEVLFVIELYRCDGGSFSQNDCEYLTEFAKWCGFTMEQRQTGIIENSIHNTRSVLNSLLSKFLSTNGQDYDYDEFLFKILKYCQETVQAETCLHYDLLATENKAYLGRLAVVDSKKLKILSRQVVLHKDAAFANEAIKTGKIINVLLNKSNMMHVNKKIREHCSNLHNVVYVPIESNGEIVGIFGLFNSQRLTEFSKADEEYGKMTSFYMYLAKQFSEMCGELKTEIAKVETNIEILRYGLIRVLKISDECRSDVEIPHQFYEYSWFPGWHTKFLSKLYIMFSDLFPNYFIEDTLKVFLLSVKNSIQFLPFHNFVQTTLSTHFAYLILRNAAEDSLTVDQKVAVMIYTVAKYINFLGFDNETLFLMNHPLCTGESKMYTQNNSLKWTKIFVEASKLLAHLPTETSNKIMKYVTNFFLAPVHNILSTFKTKLIRYMNKPNFDVTNPKFGDIKINLIVWGAEYCRLLKMFTMCTELTDHLYKELFSIGDTQKRLHLKTNISPEHDRNLHGELPSREYNLIKELILPMYTMLAKFFPKCGEIVEICYSTQQGFRLLDEKNQKAKKVFLLEDSYPGDNVFEVKAGINEVFSEN